MILTQLAIEKIDNKAMRMRIGAELGFGENGVRKMTRENKNHNKLTTVEARDVIAKLTGLAKSEILTDAPITEPA